MFDGIQSALNAHSPHAQAVLELTWVLFIGGGIVFAVVMVMAAIAVFAPRRRTERMRSVRFIVAGGVVFPTITLGALLIYGLMRADGLQRAAEGTEAPLRIDVVGEQWWWRLNYMDEQGRLDFVTANEIHIPAGRPVEFHLKSADVIHSFWVPTLAGKLDLIPGRTNRLRIVAPKPGVYRGQCAEYCGGPHAFMAFYVVAHEPAEFARWAARQREPIVAPTDALAARGAELFMLRCAACHTVRGTPAMGRLGPDLTHVATRSTLAAGVLPNNRGTMAAWISASQSIKPENLMPSFHDFTGVELRALAAFLLGAD
jgi:cytochrome c oxidase subunit 2